MKNSENLIFIIGDKLPLLGDNLSPILEVVIAILSYGTGGSPKADKESQKKRCQLMLILMPNTVCELKSLLQSL